jgi:hypothetical protein
MVYGVPPDAVELVTVQVVEVEAQPEVAVTPDGSVQVYDEYVPEPYDAVAVSVAVWPKSIDDGLIPNETVNGWRIVIVGVVAEADLPSVSVTVIVKAQFEDFAVGV